MGSTLVYAADDTDDTYGISVNDIQSLEHGVSGVDELSINDVVLGTEPQIVDITPLTTQVVSGGLVTPGSIEIYG